VTNQRDQDHPRKGRRERGMTESANKPQRIGLKMPKMPNLPETTKKYIYKTP
jgi:hypothetical protein